MRLIQPFVVAAGIAIIAVSATCGGAPSPAQTLTFDVNVVAGSMSPSNRLIAHSGDTITMIVTTDKTEEIHLHGYDFYFDGQPGLKLAKTFTADKEGNFTIEIEGSTLTNGSHLGELDVYPR
jgi:uncharacterized protein YcfL